MMFHVKDNMKQKSVIRVDYMCDVPNQLSFEKYGVFGYYTTEVLEKIEMLIDMDLVSTYRYIDTQDVM